MIDNFSKPTTKTFVFRVEGWPAAEAQGLQGNRKQKGRWRENTHETCIQGFSILLTPRSHTENANLIWLEINYLENEAKNFKANKTEAEIGEPQEFFSTLFELWSKREPRPKKKLLRHARIKVQRIQNPILGWSDAIQEQVLTRRNCLSVVATEPCRSSLLWSKKRIYTDTRHKVRQLVLCGRATCERRTANFR